MYIFKTKSPEETFKLGAQLAKFLADGDIICLAGNLGAGKTVFVQGIASSLNIEETVTSPTFNILNIYEGSLSVYHFDLYRLDYAGQLLDIGFYEYTAGRNGLAIIEWPNKFPDELPENYLWLDIKPGDNDNERLISFKPLGQRYQQLCEELKLIDDSFFRYSDPSV
ncbi:MAG: tRNA (adenosine(37)-N6)-threonylcarbamoyltransferase complex ATPase subunit type 1 TsaE [Veillonellaceae bacterium]|jgi:tRNA threonylcarbamoyladenosine biosynthesis protein TsaE|nr:tRNA (adenosine(37)-N6)-threonylcarbamoyltransferase complex ATPase subunit type 1 TsaE [Veillonellaceae bacterium]